jgi:hypothetical protein
MIPLLQIIEYFRLKIEYLNKSFKKSDCWSEATALNGQLSVFNCQSCLVFSESQTIQAGGWLVQVSYYE